MSKIAYHVDTDLCWGVSIVRAGMNRPQVSSFIDDGQLNYTAN